MALEELSGVWNTTATGTNHLEHYPQELPAESKVLEQSPQLMPRIKTTMEMFFHALHSSGAQKAALYEIRHRSKDDVQTSQARLTQTGVYSAP
jgi:hypothetical protein